MAEHSPIDLQVVAEVVDVERHTNGNILVSHLKIESIMSPTEGIDLQNTVLEVRHAKPDFELYPGRHILTLRRAPSDGEWYLEPSSHGEIIDAAERRRREDMQIWKDHASIDSVEPELCYMKIKEAYDAEPIIGEFILKDEETCEKYIPEYNQMYRRR